jgi:hypothetical protein
VNWQPKYEECVTILILMFNQLKGDDFVMLQNATYETKRKSYPSFNDTIFIDSYRCTRKVVSKSGKVRAYGPHYRDAQIGIPPGRSNRSTRSVQYRTPGT